MDNQTIGKLGIAGAGFSLFVANAASIRLFDFPFVYCWGKPFVAALWAIWFDPALLLGGIVFLFFVATKRWFKAFQAFLILTVIASLPGWCQTAFNYGGACHV